MTITEIKAGDIVEGHDGKFAKVIKAERGRYSISAFVYKREDAEKETVDIRTLNSFGLSQNVKLSEVPAQKPVVAKQTEVKKTEAKKPNTKK